MFCFYASNLLVQYYTAGSGSQQPEQAQDAKLGEEQLLGLAIKVELACPQSPQLVRGRWPTDWCP